MEEVRGWEKELGGSYAGLKGEYPIAGSLGFEK